MEHALTDSLPRRFYVQLDADDLHMLLIPTAFENVLKKFLNINKHVPAAVITLFTGRLSK